MNKILITFGIFIFSFWDVKAQRKNDCNITINEERILNNDNLDFFLKKLQRDSFITSIKQEEIPYFIREKLFCLIDTLANPDEEWQSGCMVFDERIPDRHLIFWGINKQEDIFVISYLTGGIGVNTKIMMMRLTDQGIKINKQKNVSDFWVGQTSFKGKTIIEMEEYLNKNRYFDGLNSNCIVY